MLARADDPRIALVREGVTFWNDLFARQGSGFRFGPVTVVPPQAEITAWLPRGAAAVLAGEQGQPADTPAALAGYCGQVVIALADANFVSYTKFLVASGAVVTGIRGLEHAPLDRPNVARNVILHQLGHAVGLRHNDIPQTLMCGRPAPCRSDRFEAATPKLFSLNAAERQELSAKYPSDWPKSANARKTARDPAAVRQAMVRGHQIVPSYGKRVTDVLKGMLRPAGRRLAVRNRLVRFRYRRCSVRTWWPRAAPTSGSAGNPSLSGRPAAGPSSAGSSA